MTIAGELISILGFRLEGQDALKKFNSGMDGAEDKAKSVAQGMKNVGKAALGVSVAAGGFMLSAFKDAAEADRALLRIGITAGATEAQIATATAEVRNLASQMALPINDAVKALDTLTASGMSLGDAMAFLPTVLTTAQASGAAVDDVSNTALKSASALKIAAGELQYAFDIMTAGGKAGQFELKDMSQYIPDLANSFASLGYKGTEGLKVLIALMQTVREDTGTASGAATGLANIFGKIYSSETANAFEKNFGVDLPASMAKARASGEETVAAFVRISKEAINGDLSKLPLLFSDQQFREAMQSLLTSEDSYKRFIELVNNEKVDGTALRDFQRISEDSASSIQRLTNAWNNFGLAVGTGVSGPISGALDAVTDDVAKFNAVQGFRAKNGESWLERNMPDQFRSMDPNEEARRGGYVPVNDIAAQNAAAKAPEAYKVLGRLPSRPGQGTSGIAPAPVAPVAPTSVSSLTPTGPSAAFPDMNAEFDKAMGPDPRMAEIAAQVAATNSTLASMTARTQTSVDAVVTDARQDNRQFPMTTTVNVQQSVTQATDAPAAAAQATGAAVASAVNTQAARIQSEPSQ